MLQRLCASLATVLITCASLRAQTGTVDQVSPGANASFNLDASSLVWQAQVQAGVAGQLEGVELDMTGPVGSSFARGCASDRAGTLRPRCCSSTSRRLWAAARSS